MRHLWGMSKVNRGAKQVQGTLTAHTSNTPKGGAASYQGEELGIFWSAQPFLASSYLFLPCTYPVWWPKRCWTQFSN